MKKKKHYKCVECGFDVAQLYVQYSPGNIRLMKCVNCKSVADEYIECEFVIVLIDLILHKPKAYRHVLCNVVDQQAHDFKTLLWKSFGGFLLLDAYRSLLLRRNKENWGSSSSFSSEFWLYQKMFTDVLFGNLIFVGMFLLATRILLGKSFALTRWRDLLLGILVSSYFKVFLVAMMVWGFPSSVIFTIDLLVLSSNSVALQVISGSSMAKCMAICFSAHTIKLFATQMPELEVLRWIVLEETLFCAMEPRGLC